MSNETEDVFRKLKEYLANVGEIDDEEELRSHVQSFMQDYAGDFALDAFGSAADAEAYEMLDAAMEEPTEAGMLRKVKAIIKKFPDFLDAEAVLIEHTGDDETKKIKYETLLNKTKMVFDNNPDFKDSEGSYYGLMETRPYMRVYHNYVELLIMMGKLRLAAEHAEKMLVLNTNDNLGIRYRLLIIYMVLEDEDKLTKLMAKFDETNVNFVLPAVMLYYKLDNVKVADKYLKLLEKTYPEFVSDYLVIVGGLISGNGDGFPEMYQINTVSEVQDFLYNLPLPAITSISGFNAWLKTKVKKRPTKKAKSSPKRVDFPGKKSSSKK